ncbi:YceD family protein [Elioraea sp.]|uniref:YceD family protein n=1 Tax=Elioraea sp. TaxID=2185103 RepID=UPI003F6F4033
MTPAPEFSRPVEVARLRTGGETMEIAASPAECEAVARRLGIEAVAALEASVQLVPVGAGVVDAAGTIRARLTQTCVVSLDPFEQALEVMLRLVFRPGTEADLAADQTVDPETEDEVPYAGGRFDLGDSVVETLALSLDPWPRRPGAVLELPPPDEPAPDGPFVALARRRKG